MTTVSVPDGITAPVMTCTVAPAGTAPAKGLPAHAVPSTGNERVPRPGRSDPANAYPSIAELVCPGTAMGESTSAASTRPSASRTSTSSDSVKVPTCASMRASASAAGSSPGTS